MSFYFIFISNYSVLNDLLPSTLGQAKQNVHPFRATYFQKTVTHKQYCLLEGIFCHFQMYPPGIFDNVFA